MPTDSSAVSVKVAMGDKVSFGLYLSGTESDPFNSLTATVVCDPAVFALLDASSPVAGVTVTNAVSTVPAPVAPPVAVLDASGNPVLDASGNPEMQPAPVAAPIPNGYTLTATAATDVQPEGLFVQVDLTAPATRGTYTFSVDNVSMTDASGTVVAVNPVVLSPDSVVVGGRPWVASFRAITA